MQVPGSLGCTPAPVLAEIQAQVAAPLHLGARCVSRQAQRSTRPRTFAGAIHFDVWSFTLSRPAPPTLGRRPGSGSSPFLPKPCIARPHASTYATQERIRRKALAAAAMMHLDGRRRRRRARPISGTGELTPLFAVMVASYLGCKKKPRPWMLDGCCPAHFRRRRRRGSYLIPHTSV